MNAVQWRSATRLASRLSGRHPLEGTYHEARLAAQAPGLVERASELVGAETGLSSAGLPEVRIVTRAEWVAANMVSMGRLVAPVIEERLDGTATAQTLAGRTTGYELGAALGLLSRRVLGQYELVLPTPDGEVGDTVLLVGVNLLLMERQFEFRPDEFRFWVALHECTHRAQFIGVPWMRAYFLSLVDELVASAQPEPGRLQRVAGELRAAAAAGGPLVDERGLFGVLATPDQRAVIDKVQALMSLLEGHGHVVMDRIGARELVTQDRMSRVMRARRLDSRGALLMRLIGLEMKLRQYETGAAFVAGVERHAGWGALDAAWTSPQHLPTLVEIDNPVRWLERVG